MSVCVFLLYRCFYLDRVRDTPSSGGAVDFEALCHGFNYW